MKRNRRGGVEDRWTKTVRDEHGNTQAVDSVNHGKGSRWRARYVDENGKEHAKGFSRKVDAQNWLNRQVSDQVTGTWTDPALSGVTFGAMAERWLSTKATRSAKTVAGYRSLLDTVVLPRWNDVPLRDVRFMTYKCGLPGCRWTGRRASTVRGWARRGCGRLTNLSAQC